MNKATLSGGNRDYEASRAYPVKTPPSQSSKQPRPCRMLQWYCARIGEH